MKLQLFYLVIIISISFACKKDTPPPPPCTDNGLPCATTEGKNTFGCKVNGNNWVATAPPTIGGPVALSGEYNNTDGGFYLHAVRKNEDQTIFEAIYVFGKNIFALGAYTIYINSTTKVGYIDLMKSTCSTYYYDSLNPGVLNITCLNTSETIISGTFYMDLFDTTCQDSIIHITEGRFDFNY